MEERLYTTTQLAKELSVTARTIQLWANNGLIHVEKTLGGHRRISEKEALRLAKKLGKKLKLDSVTPNASIPVDASLNIVIIDNDLDFLKLYESQFSNWNKSLPINLHTADNGIDGLLLIGAYKPNLIIVDLDLSQFDIVEMVNTLSENPMTRHCKIMLVSHHDKNDVDAVKKIPESVIIEEKPVSFARIKRLVEEIDSELKG